MLDNVKLGRNVRQGTLLATVRFNRVTRAFGYGYGYGYGYLGQDGAGQIEYDLFYTPPPIAGDYRATIQVVTPFQTVRFFTEFSVLKALTATALTTLYPRSDVEALDETWRYCSWMSLRRLRISLRWMCLRTSCRRLRSMIAVAKFHPALQKKWGASSAADFLLPFEVRTSVPGAYRPSFRVEDIAGQIALGSSRVDVANTRSSFNVYLMPRFNFVTPPLQCESPPAAASLCTASGDKFEIAKLLEQTVDRANLNPAFLTDIGKGAGGDVTLAEIVDIIFAYDTTFSPARFVSFTPASGFFVDLETMNVGRGYIIKTIVTGNGNEPFQTILFTGDGRHPDTPLPVPIRLTFTGEVIADTELVQPTTRVETAWNLVGPHSENDTNVEIYLASVSIPRRLWVQLVAFKNLLDISLGQQGTVKLVGSEKPETLLVKRFENLLGPPLTPELQSSPVIAGEGLWLFMCEQPDDPNAPPNECAGGELLFVPPPTG